MHVEEWNDSKPLGLERVTAGLGSFQTPSDLVTVAFGVSFLLGSWIHRLHGRQDLSPPW